MSESVTVGEMPTEGVRLCIAACYCNASVSTNRAFAELDGLVANHNKAWKLIRDVVVARDHYFASQVTGENVYAKQREFFSTLKALDLAIVEQEEPTPVEDGNNLLTQSWKVFGISEQGEPR